MVVDPFVETMSFRAAGAEFPRTLAEHYGDMLNVKDFGAVGNAGDGFEGDDDRAAIQRCFDSAFGGPTAVMTDPDTGEPIPGRSTTPHGITESHLNRAVYFPPARYSVQGPILMNHVYGGLIYGAGNYVSEIYSRLAGAATPIIVTNGCSHCSFRDIHFSSASAPTGNVYLIDLNWDGDPVGGGGPAAADIVGLGHNLFINVGCGGALGAESQIGGAFRIAHDGYGGQSNQFISGGYGGNPAFLIEGNDAVGQLMQGGGMGGRQIIRCTGGSFTIMSVAFDKDTSLDAFYISTTRPCYLQGIRTEQRGITPDSSHGAPVVAPDTNFVKLAGGATCTVTGIDTSEVEDPLLNFAIISGNSTLIIDGIAAKGNITATTGCKLYIRGNFGDFNPATLPDGGLPVGPSKILRQYI